MVTGDVFLERMVKKKMESKDYMILGGLMVAVLAATFAGFMIFSMISPMIGMLVVAGAIFGAWKLFSMRMLEFEYSLTNGYVAVDKIMNRSTRKRLTAFECSSAEDIGEYIPNEARLKNRSFDHRIFATASDTHAGSWYMIVQSQKTGKTLVVFDPDEDLQEAIKKFIPRTLKFEVFGRN